MNEQVEKNDLDESESVYTLSVVSGLSGIPIPSIKQYIARGLIIPYKKDTNRHLFSKTDILRLKHINKLLNEEGLNIAGIRALIAVTPCWAIKKCSTKEFQECQAYYSTSNPCWEASSKGKKCRNENCRQCEVYCFLETHNDVKSLLKTLV